MSLFSKYSLPPSRRSRSFRVFSGASSDANRLLREADFIRALCVERKRAERSRGRFVLMLLELEPLRSGNRSVVIAKALRGIDASIRDTDVAGWYDEPSTLGVLFSELGTTDTQTVLGALRSRMTSALRSALNDEQLRLINIKFHCFPDDWKPDDPGGVPRWYPDLMRLESGRRAAQTLKRTLDFFGSLIAVAALAPVFFGIAIAIRLTSPGPILFRQERVGQYGMSFTCLKFRSMHTLNDSAIHREYVTRLIAGHIGPPSPDGKGNVAYKITKDPRLTRIGPFLRRTSLDELPQFFNVLRGHMSLVGPRPPIPYELDAYDVWHRRRLLEVKPGLTGLWQVSGRSRLRFDEMVRLDLRYAATWSLWLDIKILLRTPRAVFSGSGAY